MRLTALLSAFVLASETGAAQSQREIQFADTLGANFAIQDSLSKRGTLVDYDSVLGMWHFRYQARNSDGSFRAAFAGHWFFEKRPGGFLIEDRWRPDIAGDSLGVSTYTFRAFNTERRQWQMIGTRSYESLWAPGISWAEGNELFVVQHHPERLTRIRYTILGPNKFIWRADASTDGGRTWLLDARTMEAVRIAR